MNSRKNPAPGKRIALLLVLCGALVYGAVTTRVFWPVVAGVRHVALSAFRGFRPVQALAAGQEPLFRIEPLQADTADSAREQSPPVATIQPATALPTEAPLATAQPTPAPTQAPTQAPAVESTQVPTAAPTAQPTQAPASPANANKPRTASNDKLDMLNNTKQDRSQGGAAASATDGPEAPAQQPTPLPAEEPTFTPSPEPTKAITLLYITNTNSANVREKPSSDSPRVESVVKGSAVVVIATPEELGTPGWYKVLTPTGNIGYVSASLLSPTP